MTDKLIRKTDTRCPMCFHPGHISEKYFVDWDDSKKEFHVSIALFCSPCHYRWNENLIKSLPLVIAKESLCSCGANLKLKSFSVNQIDEEVEFNAIYVCDNCSTKNISVLSQLREAVGGLWGSTKKIEIGPTGIKFEKESEAKNK